MAPLTQPGSGSAIRGGQFGDDFREMVAPLRETHMIGAHIEVVLIVTGALTAVALPQFIAPVPMLRMIYGQAPTDATSLLLARHWGLLIFLIGVLLIYAAFHHAVREPATLLAAIEKIALGIGVFGTSLRKHSVAAAIAAGDSLIALVYVLYLV